MTILHIVGIWANAVNSFVGWIYFWWHVLSHFIFCLKKWCSVLVRNSTFWWWNVTCDFEVEHSFTDRFRAWDCLVCKLFRAMTDLCREDWIQMFLRLFLPGIPWIHNTVLKYRLFLQPEIDVCQFLETLMRPLGLR